MLLDAGGGGRRRRGLDALRMVQELAGETLDFGRHGGGEKQRLSGDRQQLADSLDIRNEAHVEHPVGLVDHQDLDGVEQQLAAADVVEEPARRGDHDIGAAVDLAILIVERHAADEQGDRQPVLPAQGLERNLNLGCELPRRLQDQGARHARPGPSFFHQRQHGKGESGGLSRAGLRQPENVPARQDRRDGLRLDRRRHGEAGSLDRFDDLWAQAQIVKRHLLWRTDLATVQET